MADACAVIVTQLTYGLEGTDDACSSLHWISAKVVLYEVFVEGAGSLVPVVLPMSN